MRRLLSGLRRGCRAGWLESLRKREHRRNRAVAVDDFGIAKVLADAFYRLSDAVESPVVMVGSYRSAFRRLNGYRVMRLAVDLNRPINFADCGHSPCDSTFNLPRARKRERVEPQMQPWRLRRTCLGSL